jgi:hypothetical protein
VFDGSSNTTLTDYNQSIDDNYIYTDTGVYDKSNFSQIATFSEPSYTISAVYNDDNYIYLGESDYSSNTYQVHVYSKSDYSQVTTLSLTDNIIGIVTGIDYVYVLDGLNSGHTTIFNKSDWSQNTTIEVTPTKGKSIDSDSSYVYVGDAVGNIGILEKSSLSLTASSPIQPGSNDIYALDVTNNYIYAGGDDYELYIIDKSDYSTIQTLTDFSNAIHDIDISANYIYAGGSSAQLFIYDLSDYSLFNTDIITPDTIDVIDTDSNYVYVASNEIGIYNNFINAPLKSKTSSNVLSLGTYDNTNLVQETWELDLTAPAWNKLSPSIQPSAREDHEFEDGLLFGGFDDTNYLNDTWQWDDTNTTWTQLSPFTTPPARANFAMTKADDGNWYIYGGENSNGVLNDLWKFDGSDWNEVNAETSLVGREGFAQADTTTYTGHAVFIDDEKLYLGSDNNYLYIFDKNNLSSETHFSDTSYSIKSVYVDNNYIYVGS